MLAAVVVATLLAAQDAPAAAPAPSAPASPAPAPAAAAPEVPAPATGPSFWDDGQPGHYLQWYGAEYVAVAAGGALFAAGALEGVEPLPASIGPSVSLREPDTTLIFDPRLDDVIGNPMLQEKVPILGLGVALGAAVLVGAGVDFAARQDLHRTHAIVLGSAEALIGAAVVTEALKLTVGRLRPDFRERWHRAACAGVVERPDALDCAIVDDGFVVDREDLFDGMKSFPSGHASSSFAIATFLALQVGGEHLWSSHAPEWARPVAGLAVAGLFAGAGYVAMTRVEDHRHHLEDVAVGAGIGVASGAAAYLVHFDLDGRARRRGARRPERVTIAPWAIPGGAGAVVLGAL